MLFDRQTYVERRNELKQKVGSGLILIMGNSNSPANYPNNAYRFRQDSTFLYYFGQNQEDLIGIIDIDNDKEYLLGNDVDIEDIIWTGFVPSINDLAMEVGVANSAPLKELKNIVAPYLEKEVTGYGLQKAYPQPLPKGRERAYLTTPPEGKGESLPHNPSRREGREPTSQPHNLTTSKEDSLPSAISI